MGSMKIESANMKQYIENFKRKRPLYIRLRKKVVSLLKEKLSETDLKISLISSRTKTSKSLKEKIKRKNYSNPSKKIKDLAGARVVCGYESEFKEVENIIYELFDVNEKVDKTHELGVDRMGYHGLHYVVSLNPTFCKKDCVDLRGLYCEIQVRTVLQDSWSIVSHHLLYKNESAVPDRIKRDLNNVASLLEIAQQVFDRIQEKRNAYIKEISDSTIEITSLLSQKIDYETLSAYTKWKFPGLKVSQKWQNRLLSDLNHNKYRVLKDIDDAVEKARLAVEAYKKQTPSLFKTGTGHITKALGFVDIKFRKKHPFGSRSRNAFKTLDYLVT